MSSIPREVHISVGVGCAPTGVATARQTVLFGFRLLHRARSVGRLDRRPRRGSVGPIGGIDRDDVDQLGDVVVALAARGLVEVWIFPPDRFTDRRRLSIVFSHAEYT